MKVLRGTSFDTPIRIKRSLDDLNKFSVRVEVDPTSAPIYATCDSFIAVLDVIFGPVDGDYFIKGENFIEHQGQSYKVFYVEDKDGENHPIFFLLEK